MPFAVGRKREPGETPPVWETWLAPFGLAVQPLPTSPPVPPPMTPLGGVGPWGIAILLGGFAVDRIARALRGTPSPALPELSPAQKLQQNPLSSPSVLVGDQSDSRLRGNDMGSGNDVSTTVASHGEPSDPVAEPDAAPPADETKKPKEKKEKAPLTLADVAHYLREGGDEGRDFLMWMTRQNPDLVLGLVWKLVDDGYESAEIAHRLETGRHLVSPEDADFEVVLSALSREIDLVARSFIFLLRVESEGIAVPDIEYVVEKFLALGQTQTLREQSRRSLSLFEILVRLALTHKDPVGERAEVIVKSLVAGDVTFSSGSWTWFEAYQGAPGLLQFLSRWSTGELSAIAEKRRLQIGSREVLKEAYRNLSVQDAVTLLSVLERGQNWETIAAMGASVHGDKAYRAAIRLADHRQSDALIHWFVRVPDANVTERLLARMDRQLDAERVSLERKGWIGAVLKRLEATLDSGDRRLAMKARRVRANRLRNQWIFRAKLEKFLRQFAAEPVDRKREAMMVRMLYAEDLWGVKVVRQAMRRSVPVQMAVKEMILEGLMGTLPAEVLNVGQAALNRGNEAYSDDAVVEQMVTRAVDELGLFVSRGGVVEEDEWMPMVDAARGAGVEKLVIPLLEVLGLRGNALAQQVLSDLCEKYCRGGGSAFGISVLVVGAMVRVIEAETCDLEMARQFMEAMRRSGNWAGLRMLAGSRAEAKTLMAVDALIAGGQFEMLAGVFEKTLFDSVREKIRRKMSH